MKHDVTPFQQKISGQIRLSPFAVNIHVLMEAVSNDELSFRQLAAVLSQYPVITARLLSLANSAWAASAVPITTIESACSRLGTAVVKSISIAIAVASSFNASRCPDFDAELFWTTSILVSEGAFLLASRLPQKPSADFAQTAQTAGILHGLGLLWLAENLPIETGLALQMLNTDTSLTLNAALLVCTGTDYCQAGAWLATQWKLPDVLIVAMQQHLDFSYRGQAWETALLIGSALQMVAALPVESENVPPENDALASLGLDYDRQVIIFNKLASKYEKTRTLAAELFS
jgi:HD-like signal output (HDOD) protein